LTRINHDNVRLSILIEISDNPSNMMSMFGKKVGMLNRLKLNGLNRQKETLTWW
jgi:hypothetical protein